MLSAYSNSRFGTFFDSTLNYRLNSTPCTYLVWAIKDIRVCLDKREIQCYAMQCNVMYTEVRAKAVRWSEDTYKWLRQCTGNFLGAYQES